METYYFQNTAYSITHRRSENSAFLHVGPRDPGWATANKEKKLLNIQKF